MKEKREKGRDLTQSYDKSPYTNRNVKRVTNYYLNNGNIGIIGRLGPNLLIFSFPKRQLLSNHKKMFKFYKHFEIICVSQRLVLKLTLT